MPLYRGKTTIQSLGGNRIEWKARFECRENADGTGYELAVTCPPAELTSVAWVPPGGPNEGLPRRWAIKVKGRGPLVLESFDVGFEDPDPPVFRGFVAVGWNEATSTVDIGRVNWGGGGAPAMQVGDVVFLTLWFRNTSIPLVYSQGAS